MHPVLLVTVFNLMEWEQSPPLLRTLCACWICLREDRMLSSLPLADAHQPDHLLPELCH